MKIDINRRTFALANKTGGMSGPAVKPVAVRMVYQVANAVSLPIIGKEMLEDEVLPLVKEFLETRGLTLSEEKN